MATLGQIIFTSMIILILVFASLIILILGLAFSGSSSEVMSRDLAPVANLGEDELLSCFLQTESGQSAIRQVSVTWTKADTQGVVYRYEDGAPDLVDQNSQFRGRTQLFPEDLATGNASLLIRSVRRNDEGEYTCRISSSAGQGRVQIHLRTAAFSFPTFTLSDCVLAAGARSWFPKPNVTWLDSDGEVLQGDTNFSEGSGGIYSVHSSLTPVNVSSSYIFRIENDLVASVSRATVTDSGVSVSSYFTPFSAASSLLLPSRLSFMSSFLVPLIFIFD
ncbi:V-set domain-containing T-cell activation inhibitor 1 [Echeneis naucrates]|uniref:Ig-like domain-containing protein n=1 Tax=Echeneis naucrates TaxID=173247 RepID=A0A665X3V0_ECHNA|nr:V-set domain-containing T-cell activation inhibitor 1 [Echeneis naucrates]